MGLPDVKFSDTSSSKNPQSQKLPSMLITLGPIENTPEADEKAKTQAQGLINKFYAKTANLDKCVIGIETSKTGYHHMNIFLVAKNIDAWNNYVTGGNIPPSGLRWKASHVEGFRFIGSSVHANYNCPKGRLNKGQKFDDFSMYMTDPTKDKEIDAAPVVGVKRNRHHVVPDDRLFLLNPKQLRVDMISRVINHHLDFIEGVTKPKNIFQ